MFKVKFLSLVCVFQRLFVWLGSYMDTPYWSAGWHFQDGFWKNFGMQSFPSEDRMNALQTWVLNFKEKVQMYPKIAGKVMRDV